MNARLVKHLGRRPPGRERLISVLAVRGNAEVGPAPEFMDELIELAAGCDDGFAHLEGRVAVHPEIRGESETMLAGRRPPDEAVEPRGAVAGGNGDRPQGIPEWLQVQLAEQPYGVVDRKAYLEKNLLPSARGLGGNARVSAAARGNSLP